MTLFFLRIRQRRHFDETTGKGYRIRIPDGENPSPRRLTYGSKPGTRCNANNHVTAVKPFECTSRKGVEYAMNQEWKFKLHSVYGQILFDRKLTQSFEQVKANKGAGGIDGDTIESYEVKLEENIMELLNKLRTKTYQAKPVRRVYIPKKNGKKRPLGIPTIEDRIVQQSVVNILQCISQVK
ncbi:hypothetical protein P9277_03270, partial [Schinkia azotoformans]|nr:hypothetical protein [Schinkia azotoformans]MED4365498.1 hypothetical protein [Schinkia azotoformans]